MKMFGVFLVLILSTTLSACADSQTTSKTKDIKTDDVLWKLNSKRVELPASAPQK